MAAPLPRLGIIAGGGTAPGFLIEACHRIQKPFFVVCLEGQADAGLAANEPHMWLPFGAASKLKALVAKENIHEIVMIGRVRRPSLLEIKPDWLALKVLTKIGMNLLGDDALLRAIGKAMEEESGVKIVGIQDVFVDLLATEGQLGTVKADEDAEHDILRGLRVARALGALDVGQSVLVQQGIVLGVEAIEGTDALIERSALLRRAGLGGTLIKIAKPQQDNRYDLPTIGPSTIEALQRAGCRGVVLEAQRSLILERDRTISLADQAGLFVIGRTLLQEPLSDVG